MPKPTRPAVLGAGVSRRAALGLIGLLGAAAAGCRPMTVDQGPVGRPTLHKAPHLPPDVTLAAIALSEEQRLLDVVLATEHQHHALRHALADAKAAHEQHVKILTNAVPPSVRPKAEASARASASASASKSASKSGSQSGSKSGKHDRQHGDKVPHHAAAALAAVASKEDQLAVSTKRNAFAAESGEFARLLASMAGSAAQQAAALRLASPGRGAHR